MIGFCAAQDLCYGSLSQINQPTFLPTYLPAFTYIKESFDTCECVYVCMCRVCAHHHHLDDDDYYYIASSLCC